MNRVRSWFFRVRIRSLLIAAMVALLLEPDFTETVADEPPPAVTPKISIRVVPHSAWGAAVVDVEKVLASAAEPLLPYFVGRSVPPIVVEPQGGPIVLYERGPKGEFQVRLDTGGRRWAQHAFQFAHELGHILCQYNASPNRNRWFEESMCETASLFVLRRMADRWETDPPYPHWKGYAPALRSYAEERLTTARLADGVTLAAWYSQHAATLERNPVDRDKNLVVAAALLPFLEKQPEHWSAVAHLNVARPRGKQAFGEYLQEWHDRCPAEQRPLVVHVGRMLGVEIRSTNDSGNR